MSPSIQVFLSYASEDEPLCTKLEKHLSPLVRSANAKIWHRGKVLPGEDSANVVWKHLDTADVILFLVTSNLLASNALHDEQIGPALARRETSGARVVPVLVEPCAWQASVLAKLEPLPRNRTPVMLWPNPDEAWTGIVGGVLDVLADISARRMADDLKSDIVKMVKFVEEDSPDTLLPDLVGDTLEHSRDTWSKLLLIRAVLRRLLRRIGDAHRMWYSESSALSQMIEDFRTKGIIDATLAQDIERIRDATFSVEWGAGRPPEPGELKFTLGNYQRVFHILKTIGASVAQSAEE